MFPEWQVEYRERMQYFLFEGGGGNPNFGSERPVELWDLV